MTAAVVVIAGGVGAGVRLVVSEWVMRRAATERPVGTAAVNLGGALLLGLAVGAGAAGVALAAAGGFLAGFTTYSTWMVESVGMSLEGREGLRAAGVNLLGLYAAGVALAWVGWLMGGALPG